MGESTLCRRSFLPCLFDVRIPVRSNNHSFSVGLTLYLGGPPARPNSHFSQNQNINISLLNLKCFVVHLLSHMYCCTSTVGTAKVRPILILIKLIVFSYIYYVRKIFGYDRYVKTVMTRPLGLPVCHEQRFRSFCPVTVLYQVSFRWSAVTGPR